MQRSQSPFPIDSHFISGLPLAASVPEGLEEIFFGMGCFWGAERLFWQQEGVWMTAVGYAGGHLPYPTYKEVCSGQTGHAEVVRVVYDPRTCSLEKLLKLFFENHDPTQGMRQGNDVGTQYRSVIFITNPMQKTVTVAALAQYQAKLVAAGYSPITTALAQDVPFYYAEPEHQQYLAKNPHGYCGLRGTGVSCAI